jgi:hypothetical protein
MVNLKDIKKFFSQKNSKIQKIRDLQEQQDATEFDRNLNSDEIQEFFDAGYQQHQPGLRRRFSENFYKCLDVHKRPRLVKKSGELNINSENVQQRKRRLFSDIFNTILDIRWRWHFFMFLFSFVVSWWGFGFIWYMIALIHGDLQSDKKNSTVPCVNGIFTFIELTIYISPIF